MAIIKKIREKYESLSRKYLTLTLNRENWDMAARFIPMTSNLLKYTAHPLLGPYLRKLTRFGGEGNYTQSYIMPINRELKYKNLGKKVMTPIELVEKLIHDASHRVILTRCVCRDGFKCRKYPIDLGCIMLGESTKALVKSGIARSVTEAEALKHLDRAAELGLPANCAWPEAESYLFGLKPGEYSKMMEICFCCECCCMGMRNYKHWHKNEELRKVFSSLGWRAQATSKCVGCGVCLSTCPKEAITLSGDKIVINKEQCIGCGICAYRCKKQAIVMKEATPMKENILDHFWGMRPQI